MPKFKVLKGKHREPSKGKDGNLVWRVYDRGEIVESDSDLCAKFKNKFMKLSDSANPTNTEVEAQLAQHQEEEEKAKREKELADEGDNENEDEGGLELKIKGRGNKRTVIDVATGESVHSGFLTLEEAKELVEKYAAAEDADEAPEE